MRVTHDPVTRPGVPLVWVEDRQGTVLPYSKGLMAASIMATGLPPARAYQLAMRVEDELRAAGTGRVCADHLVETAARIIRQEAGGEICDRYLAWRRAKRSPRPIVVLIGGATGVGKSTVATELAARLDLNRVLTTDTVREVMRGFLSAETAPEIHMSSFESIRPDPIPYFSKQAETVALGVGQLLERTVTERKDVIVEGVHIVPGLLPHTSLARLASQAVVTQVLLHIEDPAVHRSHFLHRLDNEHGRNPERYLRRFEAIRRIQEHLVELAELHRVATVEAESLDDAIQAVIDLVVAEVISPAAPAAVAI